MLSGDNSIIKQAVNAKTQTDIAQEKEILEQATVVAMGKSKYGNVEKDYLDEELNKTPGSENYNSKSTKKGIIVTYTTSGRSYIIDTDGNIIAYEMPKKTEFYAKLYTDGTLILSSTEYTDSERIVEQEFRNVDLNNKDGGNYWSSYEYKTKVKKVIIYDEIVPTTTAHLFGGLTNLTNIENIDKINTSLVTDMNNMFYYCSNLTNLDVSNFDTSNVTDMSYMFYNCKSLANLDVDVFYTNNVKNMSNLFYGCSGLTNLNVSEFNTVNTTNMSGMFYGCSGLTELKINNFNTSNTTDMSKMFWYCKNLTNLDIRNFDTKLVTNISEMFYGCEKVNNLDVSGFNTENVKSMKRNVRSL